MKHFYTLLFLILAQVGFAQSNCSNPTDQLNCGDVVTYAITSSDQNTYTSSNTYFNTGCYTGSSSFNGNDKTFEIYPTLFDATNVKLEITMSGLSSDLDLFLYGGCSGSSQLLDCIDMSLNSNNSNETVTANNANFDFFYLVVDGYQTGIYSNFTLSVNCIIQGCEDDDIECGEIITLSNISSGNNIDHVDNSCVSSDFEGNDLVVSFYRSSSYVTNWVTLSNPGNIDLDIFLFDECPTSYNGEVPPTCIASSTNSTNCNQNFDSFEVSNLPSGTYYILIDGYNSAQVSNQIELSLSCESLDCSINEPIYCDQPLSRSNTNWPNRSSNYYSCYTQSGACYNYEGSWTGGERIFKFTAPENGEYSFCMDPASGIDLELFLFNNCCSTTYDPHLDIQVITDFDCFNNCVKGSTEPAGVPEVISNYYMNSGEMLWLVVDGFLGDEGSFTIEVKCNSFDCDNLFEIQCHQQFDDSNVPTSNTAANTSTTDVFDDHNLCNAATDGCKTAGPSSSAQFAKSEVAYYFDGDRANNKDVVIDIFPRIANLDVDLFVYEDCTAVGVSDCARASTWGAQKDDSVILQDVGSNEEYFVIVDGQSNNASGVNEGRYGISITCGKLTDHSPTPISCGTIVNGNTSNSNNWTSYYCNCPEDTERTGGGNNGKEDIYQFDITSQSDIIITLDQFGNQNLELYLLNAFDINACYANSRNTSNQAESIQTNLEPGTYYIVVEGHDGDEGTYQLSLEGCQDACALKENIFCEDFENYNSGQTVSSQSSQWISPYLFNTEPDCKVMTNNGAKYLQVENNNGDVCGSALNLNNSSNSDLIELSFDIFIPYYNFGNFPLRADGAEISIYEEDEKSPDNIYLAFRPHTSDTANDDRRICLNINNNYVSDGCLNGDGELFPFNRNTSNQVKVRLQKSTGNISVFINDALLGSAQNSGLNNLGMIGFRSVFNPNAGFRIDNICLEACKSCPGDVWYLVDEEGNLPCNNINVNTTSQSTSNNISMSFSPTASSVSEFIRWELRDADTQSVIETNTTDNSNYNYCCFAPGKSYYICYYYKDTNGCIQFCCIRVNVPSNCTFINPRFTGTSSTLQYQLSADDLEANQSVVAWYDSQSNSPIGTAQQISYVPSAPGTRYICCLIYDSVLQAYFICCRQICIENPYACNTIQWTSNNSNETYTLTAPTNAQAIVWYLDSPTQAVIGFNNPQSFKPSDYGVPLGSTFQVSYRYVDANGCTRFCCQVITPTPPQDPLTLSVAEVCGPVNSTIEVPITVTNFNDVNAFSFSINLDNNFAKIKGLNISSLPGIPISNILSDQQMVAAWVNSTPVDLADGSLFATISIEIIGNGFQSSQISITSNPSPIDFQNSNNQSIPVMVFNGEVCLSENVIISGTVTNKNLLAMPNVEVNLTSNSPTQTITNNIGQFNFEVDINQNYAVFPYKDGDDRNGVNISDLLRMQKHIVFIERFTDPYQWVAADLDNSQTVTVSDLLILQKLLVFNTLAFENVDSWKFIDRDYVFPTPNPLAQNYPESITFAPITSSQENTDFIGVKMGDIDASATLSNSITAIESRATCSKVNIDNHDLLKDEIIDITFKSNQFVDVAAFIIEVSFDTDKLEYMGFQNSDLENLTANSFSEALLSNGYLIGSWFSMSGLGLNLTSEDDMFTLRFKVKSDTKTADAIFISSDNLDSEFVDSDVNAKCVELEYNLISSTNYVNEDLIIKDAYPNPFVHQTQIVIQSSKMVNPDLTIINCQGQTVWNEPITINPGKNTITINEDMLPNTDGIYLYSIKSNNFSHQGKIIKY